MLANQQPNPPRNVTLVDDDSTARTDPECAEQRAEHLAMLGVRTVLELCAGPSLGVLERAYARHGIMAVGNDIEVRWKHYYPQGRWVIGDALSLDWSPYDAVVFAPPLTHGCTGRREDSLRIPDVLPRYADFLARSFDGTRVMVLPARSLATSDDRRDFYGLIGPLFSEFRDITVLELTSGRRRIRKYVDVYISHAAAPRPETQDADVDRP